MNIRFFPTLCEFRCFKFEDVSEFAVLTLIVVLEKSNKLGQISLAKPIATPKRLLRSRNETRNDS